MVVGGEHLLADRQGAAQPGLGARELALRGQEPGLVVEGRRDPGAVRPAPLGLPEGGGEAHFGVGEAALLQGLEPGGVVPLPGLLRARHGPGGGQARECQQ